ncbi:MAG TPA: DNA repair protein RecN [Gemmatimonadaceae bacterium]|nr:DNA repair protein RecN [Gemmatimonadaceae bacterium]
MLIELRIRNFAIIESVNLPLAPGFNVLSGETGAGKSIIVGALGLLVGERASSDMVRTGADRATIEGVFDIAGSAELESALDERGIEVDDGTLVLKREVAAAGARARAWINGSPATAGVLAEVGRLLVNVHGQHEAQALLDEESQRAILDVFGDAVAEAAHVAVAAAALVEARSAVAALAARRDEALKRADYLRHVVAEVTAARLMVGEDVSLGDEARRLSHAGELLSLAGDVRDALDSGDQPVVQRLGQLQRPLSSLQKIDPSTSRLQELFDAAYYALAELARETSRYLEQVEHDPARLDEVERRLHLIIGLSRKYGGTTASAIEAGQAARAELDLLDTAGLDMRTLQTRVTTATEGLRAAAAALTRKRGTAAAALSKAVEGMLPELGMPDGRFFVELHGREEVGATGAEDVEYRVALNVGHDARTLARVASGGELARVMLALKTILARIDRVPTLIFDEVDAGIGGKVGLMVGDAMRRVAEHHQVFAITHLPQIAARAHHHIVVSKGAKGGVTTADIAVVRDEERISELARMLGGDAESRLSRDHARELLASAALPKRGEQTAARRTGQRPKSRP